jgi:hypothetical protein
MITSCMCLPGKHKVAAIWRLIFVRNGSGLHGAYSSSAALPNLPTLSNALPDAVQGGLLYEAIRAQLVFLVGSFIVLFAHAVSCTGLHARSLSEKQDASRHPHVLPRSARRCAPCGVGAEEWKMTVTLCSPRNRPEPTHDVFATAAARQKHTPSRPMQSMCTSWRDGSTPGPLQVLVPACAVPLHQAGVSHAVEAVS